MDDVPAAARRGVPFREPADHEVAAGAIAGLTGSIAMWLLAMIGSPADQGSLFPLRLIAASLLGTSALDSGSSAPVVVGALLAAFMAVLYGLVFVSILPQASRSRSAVLAGGVYGAALFAPAWFGLVRVVDPILYSAGYTLPMFALHVIYGAVLGVQVPLLRKVLP
jgi:hypothetical protein